MKTKIAVLSLIAFCFTAGAQVQPPPTPSLNIPISLDFMTNIPTSTNFQTASFAIGTGIATQNGHVANSIKGDWYYRTNWMLTLEEQNASVGSVAQSFSLYGGYRKAWSNAEVFAQIGGRRNWTTGSSIPSWQAVGLIGASWFPMTGGHVALTGSAALLTSSSGNIFQKAPAGEIYGGVKVLF